MSNMFHGVVKSPDGPGSVVSDGSMSQDIGEVIGGLAISGWHWVTKQLVGAIVNGWKWVTSDQVWSPKVVNLTKWSHDSTYLQGNRYGWSSIVLDMESS
jgi:hypothetical protein